jgi:hypothetical protein
MVNMAEHALDAKVRFEYRRSGLAWFLLALAERVLERSGRVRETPVGEVRPAL